MFGSLQLDREVVGMAEVVGWNGRRRVFSAVAAACAHRRGCAAQIRTALNSPALRGKRRRAQARMARPQAAIPQLPPTTAASPPQSSRTRCRHYKSRCRCSQPHKPNPSNTQPTDNPRPPTPPTHNASPWPRRATATPSATSWRVSALLCSPPWWIRNPCFSVPLLPLKGF